MIKKYFKINQILFRNSYRRDARIPGYIVSVLVYQLFEVSVNLFFFNILFANTENLAGWSYWQVILLYAVSKVIVSAHSAWTKRGVRSLAGEMIRNGDLDFYLTKPANDMFMVSINRPRVFDFIYTLFCAALAGYAAIKSGLPIGAGNIIWFSLMGVLGFTLFYFLQLIVLIPVFWFTRVFSLQFAMNRMSEFMRYPAGVLPTIIKIGLFTIFPIVAVSYIPASVLFFEPSFVYIGYMACITIIFGVTTRAFWNLGVRHYGSASS